MTPASPSAGVDRVLAGRIRLVGFDVDGVLTDGGLYLGAVAGAAGIIPGEFKRFDIQDGLGMQLLREAGLRVVLITGRVSDAVAQRARELQVDACVQDPEARKLAALRRLCGDFGCSLGEVAFVGDDLPDLPVLRVVGLPVAVGNAVREVRDAAVLQLDRCGGHGAVREFAERLLEARGEWAPRVAAYVARRSEPAEVTS